MFVQFASLLLGAVVVLALAVSASAICSRVLHLPLPQMGAFVMLTFFTISACVSLTLYFLDVVPLAHAVGLFIVCNGAVFMLLMSVFLSQTSIRVAALREVRTNRDIGEARNLAARYDLEVRVTRLVRSGYVICDGDRYFARRSPALLYARMVYVLRGLYRR